MHVPVSYTRVLTAVESFVAAHEATDPGEAESWAQDLRAADRRGGTFSSYTQSLYRVILPAVTN